MVTKGILTFAAAATCLLCGPSQAMGLSEFLAKTEKLERKGPLALMDSDYKRLTGEYQRVSLELHRERLQDLREGRRPAYCPREGQQPARPRDALAYFRSINPQRRTGMQVKDAFLAFLIQKYPC